MTSRVGFGYDVHRLATGRRLVVGGVELPSEKGAVAHSDGDVLIHAICDALLGAAALGDIGLHFPDHDSAYDGISSLVLLRQTTALLKKDHCRIINVDATLCLEAPKIAPYVHEMREKLAGAMEVSIGDVSIKATTSEKMGFVGKGRGLKAYAVALVVRG